MKLCLTRQFPSTPPKGFFLTKIFHPNVSDSGEICVNVLKKDWNAKMGIRNVLLVSVLENCVTTFVGLFTMCNHVNTIWGLINVSSASTIENVAKVLHFLTCCEY